ncbi:hypothetical protein DFJ74DRAFT_675110 [Hyaloraphidium curvatum]|nr:hypothetical protein DFJ74DRAFT_675110 [Hyaloraphidium curvatum]
MTSRCLLDLPVEVGAACDSNDGIEELNVPPQLLVQILAHLERPEELLRLRRACTLFSDVAYDPALWRRVFVVPESRRASATRALSGIPDSALLQLVTRIAASNPAQDGRGIRDFELDVGANRHPGIDSVSPVLGAMSEAHREGLTRLSLTWSGSILPQLVGLIVELMERPWPSLKELELHLLRTETRLAGGHEWRTAVSNISRSCEALERLSIRIESGDRILPSMLDRGSCVPFCRLRDLELDTALNMSWIIDAAALHEIAPNLRRLVLGPHVGFAGDGLESEVILAALVALERLESLRCHMIEPWRSLRELFLSLGRKRIAGALRHLVITGLYSGFAKGELAALFDSFWEFREHTMRTAAAEGDSQLWNQLEEIRIVESSGSGLGFTTRGVGDLALCLGVT